MIVLNICKTIENVNNIADNSLTLFEDCLVYIVKGK